MMTTRKRPCTMAARVTEREIALIRAAAADAGVNCSTFSATATLDRARLQLVSALRADSDRAADEPAE